MFRLVRHSLLAPRALAPLLRASPVFRAPLIARSLQVCRLQHQETAYRSQENTSTAGREYTQQRRGRPRELSRWGTSEDSVMTVFEGLLAQQATNGERLNQVIFEVMKSCANPALLEAPATKAAMAAKMLSMIKEQGFPLDASVYNTLIRTYNILRHPFTPSQLLADMQENGVEPNLATYSYLIEGYCQQGNVSGATKLLEHMNANNIAINEYVYASLITGHAQNGNMEQAEGVLELSKTKGYSPGSVAYSALLCAYAQQGDFDGMLKVREQMKRERVFISNTLLVRRVIDTLSLHGHNHLIHDVLDLIKSKVWVLEDLRQLACTLFLRGEVENGLVIVRCLESYNAVPTVVGQAAVRGMVLAQEPLSEILDMINQFSEMTSLSVPVKDWILYRELVGLIFENKLSTGDQRAEDIMSAVLAMKNLSPVDNSYLYPVLAHHAEKGDIEGCLDVLDLIPTVARNKYEFYSGVYMMRALNTAKVSFAEFFSSNPRSSIALNNVLLCLSDTGRLESLAQVLRTCTSSEEVAVGQILKRISLAFKYAYQPGFLRDVVKVYIALNTLEPRPSLERSVAIIINSFTGKKVSHDVLYKELLAPLIQAGVPVGQAVSDLLFLLYQRRRLTEFKKIYNEVKDMEGIELSPTVCKIASMQSTLSGMSQVLDSSQKLLLYNELQSEEADGQKGYPLPSSWEWEQEVIRFVEISDIETALKMREDMLQRGSTLRFGVYSKFLEHYARQGDVKNMLSELEAMKKAEFTPSIVEYLNMMLCYAVQGEPEEVLTVMDEVLQNGWKLSSATTGHLIMAYLNKNSLSEALQVVHDYRDNAAPNGYYLKILLNELVKEERSQEEVGVVLQALHQRPTLTLVDIADIEQTVYLNNQRMDKAREVMEREDYQVKQANLLTMCRRWKTGGRIELVAQVAELLRETGVHRKSANNAMAVLSLYNLLKDKEGAQSLYQDLVDSGCKVDKSFTDLLTNEQAKSPSPRRRRKNIKTVSSENLD